MQTIGLRLMTAHKVAVAKWDSKLDIIDPDREDQVLQSCVQQSKDMGLDPIWAQNFFKDQMEANVKLQMKLHEIWRKSGRRPDGPAVNLTAEIRPLIDRLNKEIILYSNQTKRLRESKSCPQIQDIIGEVMAKNLSMNANDMNAYGIAKQRICLPVPISESTNGSKYFSFEAYFAAIIAFYFVLLFK